mgnify:CR=1 FL=1
MSTGSDVLLKSIPVCDTPGECTEWDPGHNVIWLGREVFKFVPTKVDSALSLHVQTYSSKVSAFVYVYMLKLLQNAVLVELDIAASALLQA